jgi:hypothetical protein
MRLDLLAELDLLDLPRRHPVAAEAGLDVAGYGFAGERRFHTREPWTSRSDDRVRIGGHLPPLAVLLLTLRRAHQRVEGTGPHTT